MKIHPSIKFKDIVIPIVAFVVIVVVWDISIKLFQINKVILPSPYEVFLALGKSPGHLLENGYITLKESVFGFLLGTAFAIILAVLFQFSRTLEKAIYPYAIAFKAIPLVALAPLVIVWAGSGMMSKVILAAVISFFPILVNAVQGFSSVNSEALDYMKTLSASKWQILTKVKFPSALPPIFAGMKISCTFAVVGAVVAEFVGSSSGIGYIVKSSSYYLDTDLTFAAIIVMALISLLFFGIVSYLEYIIVFWSRNGSR